MESITSNMQDYLKTILLIEDDNKIVRAKDIANKLGVTSSSVNSAMKSLSTKKLISSEKYGYIQLTEHGRKLAVTVKAKNDAILEFLHEILLIDKNLAEIESCNIEHNISNETLERLEKFCHFIKDQNSRNDIFKVFKDNLK